MSVHLDIEISCDGPNLEVGQFPCGTPSIYARTATQARKWARDAGWRVSIARENSSRRADQCPECRAKAAEGDNRGE